MKKAYLLLLPITLLFGTIAKAQPGYISTVAGNGIAGYGGDGGQATSAEVDTIQGICIDDSANIYICDANNARIRKVYATTGIMATIAGTGVVGYSGDGGKATRAQIAYPEAVTVDASGNVYFTDNSDDVVRKITKSTGIITTLAGNTNFGFTGDDSLAINCTFESPTGIAVDAAGNVYIGDYLTSTVRVVKAADSNIYLYAGNGITGSSTYGGPATATMLNQVLGIAYNSNNGVLYIAQDGDFVVSAVNTSGNLVLVAGIPGNNTGSLSNGPALSLSMSEVTDVKCDKIGNLWVADAGDAIIREIGFSSNYSTVMAGIGIDAYSGDGGPAINAELSYPYSVGTDPAGNAYIADLLNNRVRKIEAIPTSVPQVQNSGDFSVFPNPVSNTMTIQFAGANTGKNTVEIENITGQTISSFDMEVKPFTSFNLDVSTYASGMYFIKISGDNSSQVFKFVKE